MIREKTQNTCFSGRTTKRGGDFKKNTQKYEPDLWGGGGGICRICPLVVGRTIKKHIGACLPLICLQITFIAVYVTTREIWHYQRKKENNI